MKKIYKRKKDNRKVIQTFCEKCNKELETRYDYYQYRKQINKKILCGSCACKRYTKNKVKKLSKIDGAYIAGAIDADGHISVFSKRKNDQPQVGFTNTCKEVVDWMSDIIGHGKISSRSYNEKTRKTVYKWRLCGFASTSCLLKQIYPYLKIKQKKAKEVIDYARTKMSK